MILKLRLYFLNSNFEAKPVYLRNVDHLKSLLSTVPLVQFRSIKIEHLCHWTVLHRRNTVAICNITYCNVTAIKAGCYFFKISINWQFISSFRFNHPYITHAVTSCNTMVLRSFLISSFPVNPDQTKEALQGFEWTIIKTAYGLHFSIRRDSLTNLCTFRILWRERMKKTVTTKKRKDFSIFYYWVEQSFQLTSKPIRLKSTIAFLIIPMINCT